MSNDDNIKKVKPSIFIRFFKNLYPIMMIVSAFFIILIILTILYSKTEHFQRWANSLVNQSLESVLQPGVEFQFKSVKVSYLLGIEIDELKLFENNELIFSADEVHTGVKILPLLKNKIVVNEFLINKPKIFVYRSKIDSIWNVEKLFIPSTDTTVSEPPNLKIDLNRIRITGGNIVVFDSTASAMYGNKFDPGHLRLKNFNLNLSSEIDLEKNSYKLNIKRLNFFETNSNFKLKAFKLITEIDTSKINIKNIRIDSDNSDIELSSLISNINIFDSNPNLDSVITVFDIKSNTIDLAEISKFIPNINLYGKTRFNINGDGKYNSLNLESDDMTLNNSNLKFKLNVKNPLLENPKISMFLYSSRIYEKDIRSILADFEGIDLPNFNFVFINSSVLSFENNVINTNFDIRSPVANADGFLYFNLNDNYSYRTKLKITRLNLAPILKDPELFSKINAKLIFEGSGNSPENIKFNMNLISENSIFKDFHFKNIKAKVKVKKEGLLNIDTLDFKILNNSQFGQDNINLISLRGDLNYKNINRPEYNLDFTMQDFSLLRILSDSSMPETISTDIRINGVGTNLDDMIVNIITDHFLWKYKNISMPDLAFGLVIDTLSNNNRIVKFNSVPLDFSLIGQYKITSLIELAQNSVDVIANQINNKIKSITLSKDSIFNVLQSKKIKNDSIDINFDLTLKDSVLIKRLLNFREFNTDLSTKINFKSNAENTVFDVRKLLVNKFKFIDSNINLKTEEASARAIFTIKSDGDIDSLTGFKTLITLPSGLKFNDFVLNNTNSIAEYKNDTIFIRTKSQFMNNIDLISNMSIAFLENVIDFKFTEFDLNYNDLLKVKNDKDLILLINSKQIDIERFNFVSNLFGSLKASGIITQSGFDNFNLKLKDFDIKEIYSFVNDIDREYVDLLTGKIDSIYINANNTFENTYINTALSMSGITVNGRRVGKIYSEFQHKDTTLQGFINSYIENEDKKQNIFTFTVSRAPLNLSVLNQSERFNENAPLGFSINSKDFPLDYIAPFLKGVKNLKGFADINLQVKGDNLKSVDYKGNLKLKKLSYLLEFNNMKYYSNAFITLKRDSLIVENISIANDYYDLKNGKLNINGFVSFDGVDVSNFDIKLNAKQFKVLSNASMKSMPSMYGDFVIALNPIRLYGSPKEPFVNGEVNILNASLNMPSSNTKEVAKSKLIYRYKDDKRVEFEIVKDSSIAEVKDDEIVQKKSSDFANALNFDVGIKFRGKFVTTMEIAGLGQLFAEIGTSNPEDVVRFVMDKNSTEPSIYGADILVKENSTLKLIKTFNTKGTISFPKGTVDNPSLNLLATYNGQRITSDQISYYTVNMHIKGTKNEPLISFSYSIDGQEAQGDSSKINEDAILLLTLGKTKSELNPSSMSSGNNDFIGSTASSVASTMASSALTDFVQATGFIQSADIDIGNTVTSFDQARMKLSGEIKGIRWTLGGTVADFANNNEISIDVPIAVDLGIDWMNHFILQLTKASNANQTSTTRSQKDWEIKLKLGGSW